MESNKLILCVDDEKIVLNSLKEQLRNQLPNNYTIDVAQSGLEALELIDEYKAEGFDILLIISDYVMPGMQGDEFLSKVHNDYPESVKILLTGQANLQGISNIINRAGLFRYIQKPWEREDLVLATIEAIKSFEKDRLIELKNKDLKVRNEQLEKWAHAVVETLGLTLDSRDTTTAGHSHRMADYAVNIAKAIQNSDDPHFKAAHFNNHDIKAIEIAALLHDIGKIGIPESILLKSARLSKTVMEKLELRFYLFYNHLKTLPKEILTLDEIEFMSHYLNWLSKIKDLNEKNYLTSTDTQFIEKIESLKIIHRPLDEQINNNHSLLTFEESESLKIRYGNLTQGERNIMELHAELTYEILSRIPWPKELVNIPAIAADHHERLDGSGYYKGLTAHEIHCGSKILAVLDVFEALTSNDRPYRAPVSESKAIEILKLEANAGKMDMRIIEILENLLKALGDMNE